MADINRIADTHQKSWVNLGLKGMLVVVSPVVLSWILSNPLVFILTLLTGLVIGTFAEYILDHWISPPNFEKGRDLETICQEDPNSNENDVAVEKGDSITDFPSQASKLISKLNAHSFIATRMSETLEAATTKLINASVPTNSQDFLKSVLQGRKTCFQQRSDHLGVNKSFVDENNNFCHEKEEWGAISSSTRSKN